MDDFDRVLKCGADKVSVNTGALKNRNLISDAAKIYGSQCVVLSMDVKRAGGKFTVFAGGGRVDTGLDALQWAKRAEDSGAGEIVVNSIDTDGVGNGFDVEMLEAVTQTVNLPVVASGGAGCIKDFTDLFKSVSADAALGASVFHYGKVNISELKKELKNSGIEVRL